MSKKIIFFLGVLFVGLSLYADAGIATCRAGDMACVSSVQGILKGNAKAEGAVSLINWLMMSVCLGTAVIFGIKASNMLSDSQYFRALGPGLGSVLSAISLYLVYTMAA